MSKLIEIILPEGYTFLTHNDTTVSELEIPEKVLNSGKVLVAYVDGPEGSTYAISINKVEATT